MGDYAAEKQSHEEQGCDLSHIWFELEKRDEE